MLGALGRLDQLHHHLDVGDAFAEIDDRRDGALEAIELGDVLLCLVGVVPESGLTHLGLHRLYLALLLFDVKETSIDVRRAW